MPKAIQIVLISRHYDNALVNHFDIKKTRKLLAQKYFWPTFYHDVKTYVKGCDKYLISKAVRHKPYADL